MSNYLMETKEYDRDGLGIETNDIYLSVNTAGYYSEDHCSNGHKMVFSYPEGRRDYLFCYIVRGSICLQIDGKESVVRDGVLLVPPHISFQYHSEPIDDCFEIYWIHFSGSYAGRYLEDCGLSGSYFYPIRRMEELIVSIQTMTRELTFRQSNFENVTQSQLMYVLALTSRYYVSEKYATKNIDARMEKVMEYIYLWYAKDLSLNELAEVASLSVSRFSSLFKQTFGLYPLQYIINYRIKRACDLLRHTEYTITAIAEMVGFEDPLYFSRVFKKQMNVSPTLYRQKMNPELFVINLIK